MTVISIDGHPREEELAAYVSDALLAARAESLEAHVLECPVCASRLQRAASFQMVLHEAAASLEPEVAAVARPPSRWGSRVASRLASRAGGRAGAMGALWASAAAVLLLVLQQGGDVALDAERADRARDTVATVAVSPLTEPSVTGCSPSDPRCSGGLLASVDPLQSIDPLSTWPDDPFIGIDWASVEPLDGEPCGSGEDGGPLVCQPSSG